MIMLSGKPRLHNQEFGAQVNPYGILSDAPVFFDVFAVCAGKQFWAGTFFLPRRIWDYIENQNQLNHHLGQLV